MEEIEFTPSPTGGPSPK
jgi:serum/glucocorticoid-regulated kinase 2